MSDLNKASSEAVEAARQGEQYAAVLAAIHTAQQQSQQSMACSQPTAPAVSGSAGKWIGIGVGGAFLAVALAVSMVAFAIGASAAAVCLLVLRSVWADVRKHKG